METSPKMGPVNVSVAEVWFAVQTPNYKIDFLVCGLLTCYTDTGENDWKEQTLDSQRLRSKANTVIYQLHPWANSFTCLSLFPPF